MTGGVRRVPDDDLVRRAKEGDEDAWRELYRAHAGRLVVWLKAAAGDDVAVSAEDLAAEAWLTAAGKITAFTGTGSEFAGYLFGIARNLAANARRRAARRRTSTADPTTMADLADSRTLVSEPHTETDDLDSVRRTLGGLPQREREVIACLEVVGLDIATTAQALGLTPGAVRVARHRGLRRLRSAPESSTGPVLPIT